MKARQQWRALPKWLRDEVLEVLEGGAKAHQHYDELRTDAYRVAVAVLDAAGRKKRR